MIELLPWAKTVSWMLIVLTFHFSGWALAAPVHVKNPCGEEVISWKFVTGTVGMGVSMLALAVICLVGHA